MCHLIVQNHFSNFILALLQERMYTDLLGQLSVMVYRSK